MEHVRAPGANQVSQPVDLAIVPAPTAHDHGHLRPVLAELGGEGVRLAVLEEDGEGGRPGVCTGQGAADALRPPERGRGNDLQHVRFCTLSRHQ